MALSKTRLIDAVVNALDGAGAYDDALDPVAAKADSRAKLKIITDAIIDELVNNAKITVTVDQGIPVSTAGTASAQTGTTTGPGTGEGGIS